MGFLSNIVKGIGGAFGFGSGDKTSDVLEQQAALAKKQNALAEQRLAMQKRQGEQGLEDERLRRLREQAMSQQFQNQRLSSMGIEEDRGLSALQNPGNLASRVI